MWLLWYGIKAFIKEWSYHRSELGHMVTLSQGIQNYRGWE